MRQRLLGYGAVVVAVLVLVGAVVVYEGAPSQAATFAALAGAAAAVELAILTAVLLIVNRDLLTAARDTATATLEEAQATREEAEATRQAAQAAVAQAEATARSLEELRADRELAWSPYLDCVTTERQGTGSQGGDRARITNVGRGPAINCVYITCNRDQWRKSPRFTLAADGTYEAFAALWDVQPMRPPLDLVADMAPGEIGEAVICEDRFGTIYRFLPLLYRPPDVWRPEGEEPNWVTWYRQVVR